MNLLWRAKEILNQKGWTKGRLVDSAGQVCAYGAIHAAISGNPEEFYYPEGEHTCYSGPERDCARCSAHNEALALREALAATVKAIADELYPPEERDRNKWLSAADFNDDPSTTREMLMHVFNHAAAQWDAEHDEAGN